MSPQADDNKRRTSKTSVACQACKRRKTKCSGGPPPCEACIKLSSSCLIDPATDMRRRDSKDTFRPFKALLDAFFKSVNDGDRSLAESIYRAIQAIDHTGKLSTIALNYLHDPSPNLHNGQLASDLLNEYEASLLSDEFSPDVENTQVSTPGPFCVRCTYEVVSHERLPRLLHLPSHRVMDETVNPPVLKILSTFEQLVDFCQNTNRTTSGSTYQSVFHHQLDPLNDQPHDPASKAILSFRDIARQNIQRGTLTEQIIGTARSSLATVFTTSSGLHADSVWSWASRFVQTFPNLPMSLKMSKVYLLALQMRFLVCPSFDTFQDLPPWLRPVEAQYSISHAASNDIHHLPEHRHNLISEHGSVGQFIMPGETCSWPYSDAAIFQQQDSQSSSLLLSLAFIEHIRDRSNHTTSVIAANDTESNPTDTLIRTD